LSGFPTCLLTRLALIAVLAAAFALSACGRKGPLDPPPSASLAGQEPASTGLVMDSEGRPIAPAGPKKRIPLDVLLN
jgi:predicted small lipoprotein YifL